MPIIPHTDVCSAGFAAKDTCAKQRTNSRRVRHANLFLHLMAKHKSEQETLKCLHS